MGLDRKKLSAAGRTGIVFIPAVEGMMEFEYDEKKSTANKLKHGIDFVEVQALWDDVRRIEIPARTQDEPRILVVGVIGTKHWSVIVTYREHRVRIISARRARPEEIELYESEGV